MIDIDLRNYLLAEPSILAAVGATGVYPVRLPQATTQAAIVYEVGTEFPLPQLGSLAVVTRHNITLNIYSPSYSGLRALTLAVSTLLNGLSGPMGNSHIAGAYMGAALNTFEDEQNLYRNILNIEIYTN